MGCELLSLLSSDIEPVQPIEPYEVVVSVEKDRLPGNMGLDDRPLRAWMDNCGHRFDQNDPGSKVRKIRAFQYGPLSPSNIDLEYMDRAIDIIAADFRKRPPLDVSLLDVGAPGIGSADRLVQR